jgi:hypothetical protein
VLRAQTVEGAGEWLAAIERASAASAGDRGAQGGKLTGKVPVGLESLRKVGQQIAIRRPGWAGGVAVGR